MPSIGHTYHAKLLEPLTRNSTISVYDFGCGAGELLEVLPKRSIIHYEGVDINSASIKRAQQKYRQSRFQFQVNQPTELPRNSKTKFDLFISVGVFQYLPVSLQKKVLKEARSMLKKNGTLAISCAVDHPIYRFASLYQFFIPHRYINRRKLMTMIEKSGFSIEDAHEKGMLMAPLFSHVVVFFFDALDKFFFKTNGDLGPIGKKIRNLVRPLIGLEYQLPIDYGYTLFIQARKK